MRKTNCNRPMRSPELPRARPVDVARHLTDTALTCVLVLLAASCLRAQAQVAPTAVVKVLPQIRVSPWPAPSSPLPAPRDIADPDARLVDADALWNAPRITGALSGRRLIGPGDVLLVAPAIGDVDRFDIVRGPQPLIDSATGQVLGHQVRIVGSARRLPGHAQAAAADGGMQVQVVQARLEIGAQDRLLPVAPRQAAAPVHAPAPTVLGVSVLDLPDDRRVAGPGDVVVLDRGHLDGLAPGHGLWVHRPRGADLPAGVRPPAHARLLVTQTHLRVARALVVDAQDAVQRGDQVRVGVGPQATR